MFVSTYVKIEMFISDFIKEKSGATAIQYALIGVALAGFVTAVFGNDGVFEKVLEEGMKAIEEKTK